MIDAKRTQSESEPAPARLVVEPAKWFLRSTADYDTHRGRLFPDGTVMAECGVALTPRKALRDRGAGAARISAGSGQVCPQCRHGGGDAR